MSNIYPIFIISTKTKQKITAETAIKKYPLIKRFMPVSVPKYMWVDNKNFIERERERE